MIFLWSPSLRAITCLKGAAVCNRSLFKSRDRRALARLSPAQNNLGRDRDPLVAGAGIGDCFHGIEEIILDRPFPGEFLRHFHFMQGSIAYSTGFDHIGSEIVNQGPGRAVNFQAITSDMSVDTAEFEDAFRAVREVAKH